MTTRRLLYAVAIAAGVLLLLSLILMFLPRQMPNETPAYILRAQNGQVVLCRNGEEAPVAYYDIYTVLLPPDDAAALENGITAANRAEAQQMLEDLGL